MGQVGQTLRMEMRGMCKSFGLLKANDRVSLQVRRAEVHALLGENGAGKSTLMAMLFGMLRPDAGEIYLDGHLVDINGPLMALAHRVGMMHQHFKLVDRFSVLDNIALGLAKQQQRNLRPRLEELGERYRLSVDLDAIVGRLSVGDRQKVEILKGLNQQVDLLILDEPTAVLRPQEVDALMRMILQLKDEGKSVIFISHKIKEIKRVADRCTVLRRGRNVATCEVERVSMAELAELMVGRHLSPPERPPSLPGPVSLECRNLCVQVRGREVLHGLNLQVRTGEIVGIAGVSGNGQHELFAALHGRLPVSSGHIFLNGMDVTNSSIKQRFDSGLGYVADDRHRFAVVDQLTLAENLLLREAARAPYQRWGFLRWQKIYQRAKWLSQEYDVRGAGDGLGFFSSLSGGNQQKAVLARELEQKPRVLLAEQPTRGLDAGATTYVHQRLLRQRVQGMAILLVSFELDELMALADRIVVFSSGRVSQHLEPPFDEYEIGSLMGGLMREGEGR